MIPTFGLGQTGFGRSLVAPPTSYANPGGQGDRTATITVTTNLSLQGGTIDNLIDGLTGANGTEGVDMPLAAQANGDFIRFTFATRQYIDELTWLKSSGNSEGAFFIKGGDTVGGLVTLASTANFGNATNFVLPFSAPPPPEGYLIYQIEKNGSGSWDNTAWTLECNFKIAPGAV